MINGIVTPGTQRDMEKRYEMEKKSESTLKKLKVQ